MLQKTNEIIKIGYQKLTIRTSKKRLFNEFKYPVNELRVPKGKLSDGMAVCEYTNYNIGKINAYIRTVINVRFPERKFALRKQNVKNLDRVVVFRIK